MAEFDLQQRLTQQQTISQKQIQALQLLNLPIFELEQSINQNVEINPILEYEEFAGDTLSSQIMDENLANDISDKFANDEENTFESYLDSFSSLEYEDYANENKLADNQDGEHFESSYEDNYANEEIDNYFDSDARKKRDNFFDSIVEDESMHQQLLNEIHYINLSDKEFALAENIIGNIDDSGILSTTIADIAMSTNSELDEVEKVLKVIQSISVAGVGARDLAECLKLQLIAKNKEDDKLFELIDNHLEDIAKNRILQISKAMNITITELNYLIEEIKQLNPHPGSLMSSKKGNFIIPEGEIKYDEKIDDYILIMNDYYIPKIKISDSYNSYIQDKTVPKEDRQYIRQKLRDASNLTTALSMREHTLERIAKSIMIDQHEFWSKGVDALKPMTMSTLAQQLELHEATISRACANKYLVTPQGLLEFRYFFTHAVKNDEGENMSNLAIKEKIRQLIELENPKKPLSDDKLTDLLKTDGISISRRTVAKYRDAMKIQPTHLRKQHV